MNLTTRKAFLISLAFNAFWLLCVVFQMQYWPVIALIIASAIFYEKSAMIALLIIAPIGIATDFFFSLFGVFSFPNQLGETGLLGFPMWLILLWFGFSVFAWLMRKIVLQSYLPFLLVVCGVAGASSYYAGFQLGAVDFPMGLVETLAILSITWVLLAAVFFVVIRFLSQDYFREKFEDLTEVR